ncbi:MAG TPA: prenyltransferase/squalene oxidase repeat-containing protein [Thermomicrobiales bacterium]|nr:prenyltransferase/squalene oxidase repeat-containing protein [Thermomicrobiales bacterium]
MTAIDQALSYLDREGRSVDTAWARIATGKTGDPAEALEALAAYQNPNGGFGHGLEPDIAAPESNPFAARIALQILCDIGASPTEPVVKGLLGWLVANQEDDGGWRFSPEVYAHDLAPWFAGWTFPSLNPSLDLAGFVARLRLDAPELQQRTLALFRDLASLDTIGAGGFYDVLPFAEYTPWVDHPDRDAYLAAIIAHVATTAETGGYEDAGHFFEHAGPPHGLIARGLSPNLIAAQLARLREEQQPDGGWPTPYDVAWRSWTTARNAATLAAFG